MARSDGFRFFAFHGDRRSSEWAIQVGGRVGTEVYLSTRGEFGNLKISLHSSGYCQHGFTGRFRDQLAPDRREALDKWKLAPLKTGDRITAYRIVLPGRAMALPITVRHPRSQPLPLMDLTNDLVIDVVLARPATRSDPDFPASAVALVWPLGDGRMLELEIREQPGEPDLHELAQQLWSSSEPEWLGGDLFVDGPAYAFGVDERGSDEVRRATEVLIRN